MAGPFMAFRRRATLDFAVGGDDNGARDRAIVALR